ncbi:MAG: V-type ATP synthase subunit D [Sedimentisphaerales bacterium]|nr:V-type ATP synthase subunit D [Sedimentisphaerales bacterium]
MLTNVNATRMELLQLRRRVALAGRGHYLLSEKRDEISRNLLKIAKEIQPLRKEVLSQLRGAFGRFILAQGITEPEEAKAALEVPVKQVRLAVNFARIMNVKVPQLKSETEGQVICYGFASTSGELDIALMQLEKAFDGLIKLAEKEKQAYLLAVELQMTRRRVNVLEHIVIPNLHETIRFIFDKLTEIERDNITRLMKITDIIRA